MALERLGLAEIAGRARNDKLKLPEKTTKYLKKTLALYAKICYNFARY